MQLHLTRYHKVDLQQQVSVNGGLWWLCEMDIPNQLLHEYLCRWHISVCHVGMVPVNIHSIFMLKMCSNSSKDKWPQ